MKAGDSTGLICAVKPSRYVAVRKGHHWLIMVESPSGRLGRLAGDDPRWHWLPSYSAAVKAIAELERLWPIK